MIHFDINGQVLSVENGTVISFELISPLFIDDTNILPGSYTFPFSVPNTMDNRKILEYPDREDKYKGTKSWDDVSLYFDGKPIFNGKLYLMDGSTLAVTRLTFIMNSFDPLSDISIKDLDLGTASFTSSNDVLTKAKDSAVFPENYEYTFFPILNADYISEDWAFNDLNIKEGFALTPPTDGEIGDIYSPHSNDDIFVYDGQVWQSFTLADLEKLKWKRLFQNYWNTDTLTFEADDHAPNFTPFIKVYHVFKSIIDQLGYRLIDGFFNNELKRLYLYNNKSINYVESQTNKLGRQPLQKQGTNFWFDLGEHVPDVSCLEFLKQLRSLFFIAILPSPFNKRLKVVKYKDLYHSKVRHNWTDKILIDYSINHQLTLPKTFGYSIDEDDRMFEINKLPINNGVLYEEAPNNHYLPYDTFFGTIFFIYKKFKTVLTNGIAKASLLPLIPIFNYDVLYIYKFLDEKVQHDRDYRPYPNAPITLQKGTYVTLRNEAQLVTPINPDNGNPDLTKYKTLQNSNELESLRLLFYRGVLTGKIFKTDGSDVTVQYPYASPSAFGPLQDYDNTTTPVTTTYAPLPDNYSLLWNGDKGIANQWGKEYFDTFSNNSGVSYSVKLTIADILNFVWEDKVRIKSNNYLVKTLKISLTHQGLQPTVATVVRTI